MTRKHFIALARGLRQEYPVPGEGERFDLGSDVYWAKTRQWDSMVLAVADVCRDFNGAFDRGRFLVAAGYTRRPDGSMYPMAAPR